MRLGGGQALVVQRHRQTENSNGSPLAELCKPSTIHKANWRAWQKIFERGDDGGTAERARVMSWAALVAGDGAAWPSPASAVCARSAARTRAARSDWSTPANPPAPLEVGYGTNSTRSGTPLAMAQ